MPMAVRTLAPQGQAPVLRVKLTRGHLSAINGIRLDECLFIRVRPTPYDSEAVVGFLCVLLRKLPASLCSFGTAHLFIALNRSRTFSSRERSNASSLNNCLVMPPIQPLKASETFSGEWSWAMSVAPILIICTVNSSKPKNVCATKTRSSKAVLVSVATWFSFLGTKSARTTFKSNYPHAWPRPPSWRIISDRTQATLSS
jgi:hypothetical protein